MNYRLMKTTRVIFLLFLLQGCSSVETLETPPRNTQNICAIFAEKQNWLPATEAVFEKWDLPVPIQMAIMRQESRFVANAKPKGTKSSAYGYAQVLDSTWQEYLENNPQIKLPPERSRFADACAFTGWYCALSYQELGISMRDAYNLYLAYHEGRGGYKRKSYLSKPWLLTTAKKVAQQALIYQQQLADCYANLERKN